MSGHSILPPLDSALLIFVKNPVKGRVKTRIALTAGPDKALDIYLALQQRTRQTSLAVPAERYLYYSDWIATDDEWPSAHFHKRLQSKGDLGARMHEALAEALTLPKKAILIGSDIPLLTPGIIAEAFHQLDHHDLVIGPAGDGGYYLIGLTRPAPELFNGMAWSTPSVFEETIRRAEALGLSWFAGPELPDIDYLEDWEKYGWPLTE